MKKMKYKVGDKVRIRSKEWYDKHKDERGEIVGAFFDKDRAKLCGTIQTIANSGFIDGHGVTIYAVEDAYEFIGEEAIEGLVEDEMSLDKAGQITDFEYEGLAYTLPDGYIFRDENGNVINATKIVLEKKKKEYPKTYEECLKILNTDNDACICISAPLNYTNLLITLTQLLICRDAYWKIVGDWKLEYPFNTARYVITNSRGFWGKVLVYDAAKNYILEFPTEEMRDEFYENFKKEIEKCKELL